MKTTPVGTTEEELRRTIRDLVALSTLPAVWSGAGAARIAESLADLLLSSLHLEMIYIRAPGSKEGETIEVARRRDRPFPASRLAALGKALAPWLESEAPATGRGIVNPVGSGTIFPFAMRFVTAGSHGALFAGSGHPGFPTERDRLLLSVGVNHMVVMQQRDHAEAALRESEARFRRLADTAPLMIWLSGPDGGVTFHSDAWFRFTGQTAATSLGDGWLDPIHRADRKRIQEAWTASNANHADTSTEYRLRRIDGEYRWVYDSASPRFGEHGEFLGYIGSVIDITDRKLAEEKLAESERRYATVLELIPQLVWSADADGQPVYFNKRWYEFTGMEPGTLALPRTVIHPDDYDRSVKAWEDSKRGERTLETEFRIRRADGGYEWFLMQAVPSWDDKGKLSGWFATGTNIDAQRRSRERTRQV